MPLFLLKPIEISLFFYFLSFLPLVELRMAGVEYAEFRVGFDNAPYPPRYTYNEIGFVAQGGSWRFLG